MKYLRLLKVSFSLTLPLYFLSLAKRAILESEFKKMHLAYATTGFLACGDGLRYPYRSASCSFGRKPFVFFLFVFCFVLFFFLLGQLLNLFLIYLKWSVESEMSFH